MTREPSEAVREKVARALRDHLPADRLSEEGRRRRSLRLADAAIEVINAERAPSGPEVEAVARAICPVLHEDDADEMDEAREYAKTAIAALDAARSSGSAAQNHEGRFCGWCGVMTDHHTAEHEAVKATRSHLLDDDEWQYTETKPHPNDPMLRSPERNTVGRIITWLRGDEAERIRGEAINDDVPPEDALADAIEREFPVSGENENER